MTITTKKLLVAVFATMAVTCAYCAGKSKGLALAKAKATLDDVKGMEKYYNEDDFSEAEKEEDCCFTEADYENRND